MAHDGDRHRHDVVGNRERQVLSDQAPRLVRDGHRERYREQALPQKDKVRRAPSDVRGGSRRHRRMGGAERRRVVEPVADHQNLLAGRSERVDARHFLAGRHAAAEGNAECDGDTRDRRLAVTGNDLHGQAILLQLGNGDGRVDPQRVLEAEAGHQLTVPCQND